MAKLRGLKVAGEELERLMDPNVRRAIVDTFETIGFPYVSLDLEGYRTGSMTEALGRNVG